MYIYYGFEVRLNEEAVYNDDKSYEEISEDLIARLNYLTNESNTIMHTNINIEQRLFSGEYDEDVWVVYCKRRFESSGCTFCLGLGPKDLIYPSKRDKVTIEAIREFCKKDVNMTVSDDVIVLSGRDDDDDD